MKAPNLSEILRAGLTQENLDLPLERFLAYIELLDTWNRTYNLTAIRDKKAMITHHLLDSLAILPWIKGPRILDVGSGAGLPGIPLALACPHWQVVLLDSLGKKTRFLREAKRVLSLDNVQIVQTRVEAYRPAEGFDTVTSRAFSTLSQMLLLTRDLVVEKGVWLAMKGRIPQEELAALSRPYRVESYTVLGIEGERCCIVVER